MRHPVAQGDAGGKTVGVERTLAITGGKAEKTQDAQIIFGDAPARVADEAHPASGEVVQAADIIVNPAPGVDRERVDGEIAPLRVGGEIASETHLGAAPVGLDILAQRSDLEMRAFEHQGHRAVLDPGGDRAQPGALGFFDDDFGRRGDGEIDIRDRLAEQSVAHGAADHPRLHAFERAKDPFQRRAVEQTPQIPIQQCAGHWKRPGVRRP